MVYNGIFAKLTMGGVYLSDYDLYKQTESDIMLNIINWRKKNE